MIDIKVVILQPYYTNCYILIDDKTGDSAVVDPGARSEKLISFLESPEVNLKYIILTHGHYDHIGFARELRSMFPEAKLVGGEYTDKFLNDNNLNHSACHPDIPDIRPFNCDIRLRDGDTFTLADSELKYIYTPGHTIDSGCYILDDVIFAGDTLFRMSYGRTDLPTGDDYQMIASLKRLKELEGDYTVLCGHGTATTLDEERRRNPLMSRL